MDMSFAVKKMPTIGGIFSRKTHSDPVRPLPKVVPTDSSIILIVMFDDGYEVRYK